MCSSVSSIVSTDGVSWSKSDESRLRQHLVQLRDDRSVIKLTIVDLESVHLDPFTCEPRQDACEAQKLDLENAVLMQELMAVKVNYFSLHSLQRIFVYCQLPAVRYMMCLGSSSASSMNIIIITLHQRTLICFFSHESSFRHVLLLPRLFLISCAHHFSFTCAFFLSIQ